MALTPQLAEIKNAVAEHFADDISAGRLVIRGGVYNCRPMRPQPHGIDHIAYSEHAWENAWDLYYGDRPRRYVEAVVSWLKAEKRAGRLPVGSVIRYGPRGSHVHIEGSPKRNPRPYRNIPPCAGGVPQIPDGEDEIMITDMQKALNAAGFTDHQGKELAEDGKWGPRTASAHAKMVAAAGAGGSGGIESGSEVTISGTISQT